MKYQKGQIVKCKKVLDPEKRKLVGCVGEIKEVLNPIQQLLFGGQYAVFFPAYPSGLCPHCQEEHDPLIWLMWHVELGPVDDPDDVEGIIRTLEELLEA